MRPALDAVEAARPGSARSGRKLWRCRSRRGVSDVVATILLLALTVTLFSAIFAFVTSFPPPPAQNVNQFQASLLLSANGGYATGVAITHLAGPSVPLSALFYFKSAVHPGLCPFAGSATAAQGGISSGAWSLGQVWSLNFTSFCGPLTMDQLPDNITVYVVSQANLIFSVVLPGQQISTPPAITSTWVSPSPVIRGFPFVVHATIVGAVESNSVYANLAAVAGLPSSPVRMVWYQGQWTYNVSAPGATSTGTYYGFINATGVNGQTASAPLTLTVTTASVGLTVSISAVPTSGGEPLKVAFAANVSGAYGSITFAWVFGDGNTSTSSHPTNWYNRTGTYLVSLTVTDSGGNQGTATATIRVS